MMKFLADIRRFFFSAKLIFCTFKNSILGVPQRYVAKLSQRRTSRPAMKGNSLFEAVI
jgi:hypothetical protein